MTPVYHAQIIIIIIIIINIITIIISIIITIIIIRLKKKNSISQSLRQIEKPDLNAVFFFFFFFFFEQQTLQIWVGHNFDQYEIWNLVFGSTSYTKQNTEFKKSVVQSVLLCLLCLFIYILTSKLIKKKNTEKRKKK